MKGKDTWLSLLVCVNLLLATGIALVATTPPVAKAQTTGLSGNYMMVAGSIQSTLDALYVVDLTTRRIHVFDYDVGQAMLIYRDFRDLERDFRNN